MPDLTSFSRVSVPMGDIVRFSDFLEISRFQKFRNIDAHTSPILSTPANIPSRRMMRLDVEA